MYTRHGLTTWRARLERNREILHEMPLVFIFLLFYSPLSKLPYDVSNDQALEHKEVQERVASTIQVLTEAVEQFQQSILSSIDKIP